MLAELNKVCHFILMKNKALTSKICVLLAIIFFINPVLATADALFSSNQSKSISEVLTDSSDSMPCHDEKITDLDVKPEIANVDAEPDCCADVCLCDDAGCHTSSLVFQFNPSTIFTSQQDHFYHLPIYLSLAFTPSSPPPIV